MLSFIGIGTFVFFFGGILRANARRWRQLATTYAGIVPRFTKKKQTMQSAVLVSSGGFYSLKGILTIGAHEKGISLSVMKPFSLFHEPLFIPYSDIQSKPTNWYLNASSVELTFRRNPNIKLIMSAEQLDRLNTASAQKLAATSNSPQRHSPTSKWHTFATVHAGISLAMVGWLAWVMATGQLS